MLEIDCWTHPRISSEMGCHGPAECGFSQQKNVGNWQFSFTSPLGAVNWFCPIFLVWTQESKTLGFTFNFIHSFKVPFYGLFLGTTTPTMNE